MMLELGDEDVSNKSLGFVDEAYPRPENRLGSLTQPLLKGGLPSSPSLGTLLSPYARLRVFRGQLRMPGTPWAENHFPACPFIVNIDLSNGVDFLRGSCDEGLAAMAVTLRSCSGADTT